MLTAKSWKLTRFGKLIRRSCGQKEWQYWDEGELTVSLLNDHKLLVTQDTKRILESLQLWESKRWIKGYNKSSTVMLMIKSPTSNSVRKIRFRFAADGGMSETAQSAECYACLSAYFTFEKTYNKTTVKNFAESDRQPEGKNLLISEMSKLMLTGDVAQVLGTVYNSTVFPVAQIRHMITLCLSDPNFPGFVMEVEKQLKQVM